MRLAAAILTATLVVACAPKEEEMPAPPPAAMTVADFAGMWQVASVLEGTPDTVRSTLNGTSDPASWTLSLEGRPNVPVTVSISGDSLVSQSAEYESVLRPGVMVTVRTAGVMSGGMMHGNLVARYKTAEGEQVVNGTFMGTKQP